MSGIQRLIRKLLEHPVQVGLLAALVAIASLLAEGTLLHLWDLKREKVRLQKRYAETVAYNQDITRKIKQARSSERFIAREARDRLDLVREDELVFIFEDETPTLGTLHGNP
jgi:cell division protein FtsB